ncbi:TlpA disulfide reductase family protein [Tepidiforma sp.]|uniref:TlpA family protein disulfide reductase n=1 Tax=Tepidiforma sp. TaxID=2682230 RepID=UPI002ADD5401|nr:TlpA disulfide reductase family protein [Tepidiforma sp.]
MTEQLPDERPQRRREYSGPASTLGLAALVIAVVGLGLWWFEFRDDPSSGSSHGSDGLGIVELPAALNPTDREPAAREGRAAPNFRLASLDGPPRSLDQFRGSYVLLNFWASWCGPCRAETPDLQDFYSRNLDRGIVVIGINQQEDAATARQFTAQFGVTYPILLDSSGAVSQAYATGIGGLPRTYLVSPDGIVERIYLGRITFEQLRELEAALQ